MKVNVKDCLGIDSGVRIDNVRAVYDEKKENMRISGMLYFREHYQSDNHEPVIVCTVLDKSECLITAATGTYWGNINQMNAVPFCVTINGYSFLEWNETSKIELYVM